MRYNLFNSVRYIWHNKWLSIIIVLLLTCSGMILAISIAGVSGTSIAHEVEFQLQEGDIWISWSGKVLTEEALEALAEEVSVPIAMMIQSDLRLGDTLYPAIYVAGELPATNEPLIPVEQLPQKFQSEGIEGYYDFLQPVVQVSYRKALQNLPVYTQQYFIIKQEGKRLSRYVPTILAKYDDTSVVHEVKNHTQYANERVRATRDSTVYQVIIAIVLMIIATINIIVTLRQYIQQILREIAIKMCLGATDNHVMCEIGGVLGIYFVTAMSVVLFRMSHIIDFFGLSHYAYWSAKEGIVFVGLCAECVVFYVWYFMLLLDKSVLIKFLSNE